MEDPLARIQREISEVVEREHELKNGYNRLMNGRASPTSSEDSLQFKCKSPELTNGTKDNYSSLSPSPPPPKILQRALSTSTLTFNSNSISTRRFIPNPEQRGIMQRFLKSKGKLSLAPITPIKNPTSFAWAPKRNELPEAPKSPVKMVRKGYIPVEERIQRELREMQNRENELRNYRRKTLAASQPDLLAIIDQNDNDSSPLSSPPSTPKLKNARSLAQLCGDEEDISLPSDTVSAPSSLRPAVSLAKLCDGDLDESEVPSSSQLIAKFESIIQQNRGKK